MIKTYGNTIFRKDEDGDNIPFKISATTLILYKEFVGSDLLHDLINCYKIDYNQFIDMQANDIKTKVEEELKTSKIEKVDTDKMFKVCQNLILCARLAAFPTAGEREEALAIGPDILPANIFQDFSLAAELINLVHGDFKKKQK